jgi:hypothetical protein
MPRAGPMNTLGCPKTVRTFCQTFVGEIEESYLLVCHFYLPEKSDIYIGTKSYRPGCPLPDVLGSACGTPPLCPLGLTPFVGAAVLPGPVQLVPGPSEVLEKAAFTTIYGARDYCIVAK